MSVRLPKVPRRSETLLLALSVVFLLFFRAPWAFRPLYVDWDDGCYLGWLQRFITEGPSRCVSDAYFPGTALLWVPAGLLGRLTAAIGGGTAGEWTSIFIGLTAFACWGATLFLLDRLEKNRGWRGLVFLLNIPALYYCTRRTHLAHAAELVLAFGFLAALESRRYRLCFLLACWLSLTRVNDAPVFFVLLGKLVDEDPRRHRAALFATALALEVAALGALYLLTWKGYNGTYAWTLYRNLVEVTGLRPALLWPDFGLLWSTTFWLLVLALGTLSLRRLSWAARGGWLWMLSGLIVCGAWWGNGNDFGYRYLIGTFAGAWLVLRETENRVSRAVGVAGALWMTHSTWVYQTAPYLAPHFQWNAALRLAHPKTLLVPLGVSPPGFIYYSLHWRDPGLAAYARWSRLALHGPALWTLEAVTAAVLATAAILLWWRLRRGRGLYRFLALRAANC